MPPLRTEALFRKVARKVLASTLSVKEGEAVTVETWNNGLGFARAVVTEARAMGASAVMLLEDERAFLEGAKRAPKDTIGLMGRQEFKMLEGTDAYVFIPGPVIGAYSRRLKGHGLENATRYNASWYEAAKKAGLRGARMSFGYVGREMAGLLGKEAGEVVEAQLTACLADTKLLARSAARVAKTVNDDKEAVLESAGGSLTWRWKGDIEVQDGVVDRRDIAEGNMMAYMPGGLVLKEVAAGSASGTVSAGRGLTTQGYVQDATLTFKRGKLTGWESRGSKDVVDRLMAAVPEEKRKLLWVQVGLNPRLRFGNGLDRFASGAISLAGFGFSALVKGGTLASSGVKVVEEGKVVR